MAQGPGRTCCARLKQQKLARSKEKGEKQNYSERRSGWGFPSRVGENGMKRT